MIFMLHSVEHRCFLGSVEVPDNPALLDDPDAQIEMWWREFQATEPDSDSQFVAFLTLTGAYEEPEGEMYLKRANEGQWDGNPNDTPHHCYLG
jgi:hypothetical protein